MYEYFPFTFFLYLYSSFTPFSWVYNMGKGDTSHIFSLCTRKLHPKPIICGLKIENMLGNCQALKQKSSLKIFITDMGMNTRILRYCGQCGDIVTMGKNGKGY